MFKQLSNTIRITKPRHIFRALTSPSHALEAFKYHYRRVSELEFVKFFAKKWNYSSRDVNVTYYDYENNIALWEENKKKLAVYPGGYALQMTKDGPSLYLLIRLIKPNIVVETGVASGFSSCFILQALMDNKKGKLYSIDLPPKNLLTGKVSGWVVPQYLRTRWTLHIGDSKALLERLLQKLGEIDCFFHDSLHTYEHMMWEYRTAWKQLRPQGLFLSHDVGANCAFFDFMKEKGISWKDYRVFHVLGGFQKRA